LTTARREFVNQELGNGTDPHRGSIEQVECGLLDSLFFIRGGTTPRVRIFCLRQRNIRCDVAMASTTFHRDSESEMIIARLPKYSVSHFIDADAIAHRLCASLIAAGNAAGSHQKDGKHE
jgi:hypothetical protein